MEAKTKVISPYFRSDDCTLYHGDCIEVMKLLRSRNDADFDFVLADPPFNINHGYEEYDDRQDPEKFSLWTLEWFKQAWFCTPLEPVAVHCPDSIALVLLKGVNNPKLLHWINWHYRFGQAKKPANATSCINCREHLLVYGKEGRLRSTFNPPLVASDRASKYADKRTQSTSQPGQRVAFNIWGLPEDGSNWGRVQGNNAERWNRKNGALVDHPNQLPEVYIERILRTFTNEGDRVLVPFAGSGTEMVVGAALGRRMVGIEIGEVTCRSIVRRIEKGAVRV